MDRKIHYINKIAQMILVLGMAFDVSAQTTDLKVYQIDPAQSELVFSIEAKCRMLPGGYTVEGHFSQLSGKIDYNETDFSSSKIQVEVPVSTIKTETKNASGCAKVMPGDDATRDEHLRTDDFFDVPNFKTASFKSLGKIQAIAPNVYALKGRLTIRGMPQTITLELHPVKKYKDNKNQNHIIFEAQTALDRTQFGVGPASGDITGLGSAMIAVSNELVLSITIDAYEARQ